jgi:hypothetical protein
MPFESRAVFDLPVLYRLNNQAEVMLLPGEFALKSDQFRSNGTQQFNAGSFDDYLADPVAPGASLRFELVLPGTGNNVPLAALLVMAGVGLLMFSAALGWQSKTGSRQRQRDALVEQIGELDIRYRQGIIEESSYQQQRADLKQRLAALMEQMQDHS